MILLMIVKPTRFTRGDTFQSSSDALSCSTSPVQMHSRPGSPWDFSENANSLLNMNNSTPGLNGFLFPNSLPGSSSDQALANIQPTTVSTPRGSQKQFLCPMCNRHFTQKGKRPFLKTRFPPPEEFAYGTKLNEVHFTTHML